MRTLVPFAAALTAALGVSALLVVREVGATPVNLTGDAAHGKALVEARCAACHGGDGNGGLSTVPRLAGQENGYLYRQLRAFSDGARVSPAMADRARTSGRPSAVQ